jgi:serine/tyrosine/threonine adenylyltransferase
MATKPFEPWGAEFSEDESTITNPEIKEERRFCGVGSREMLGFQCSCSS